jgi:hypothetical protein
MARAQSFPLAIRENAPPSHWDGELAADIFAPRGTPWLAVFDGVAVAADYPLGGHTVTLTASDGTQAYYAHGAAARVSGYVHAGDQIGQVDTSGNAAGTQPHLHFAVGVINSQGGGTISPAEWLAGVSPVTVSGTYQDMARQAAMEAGIDPGLFVAQIGKESSFNPNPPIHYAPDGDAILGIAQWKAGTAASRGVSPLDPKSALYGAARYMRELYQRYGSYEVALAAYNAGEGAVQQYGGVPPYDETQAYVRDIMGAVGHPINADPLAFLGPYSDVAYPETHFGVVPGSVAYGNKLYGRRYRLIVTNQVTAKPSSTVLPDTAEDQVASARPEVSLDVSQLHCTFRVVKTQLMAPNLSIITIYNLSPKTENAIIQEGYRVVIEAGYVGSQYGGIFDGNVVQVLRSKENGTDYVLTLVSADSDAFLAYGTANFTLLRGQNHRDIIDHVVSTASVPTEIGRISPNLSDTQLTRGRVFFGSAADILKQVADSQDATFYMEDGRVNIVKPEDLPYDEVIELSPSTGLIGVPVQQDAGATIRMLLNPKVKLGSFVHVDNSLIRTVQQDPAAGQQPYSLDQDGLYRVIKITHLGDSRGPDWYTEVETITQSGKLPALMTSGDKSIW